MEEYRYRAHTFGHDYLTGLPDMNYFFELSQSCHEIAAEKHRSTAMMFMDLHGMQAYNQRYGYTEGDKLIKSIADILVQHFSIKNCCRITADHFAVCTFADTLDKHIPSLIKDFGLANDGKNLPVRMGVYKSDLEAVGSATACDRAKIACDSCGNIYNSTVVYFDKKLLDKFENKRYVFENFEMALDEGWLYVNYQPIVRTSNGKVCCEEALVRWQDPTKGLIPPLDFIPILEDAKIAYKLDLYVAEQVINKLKKQSVEGLYVVPTSINLSRTDFHFCDMVEEIRRRVDDAGLERSSIIIEITESIIMDDVDFMMVQINRFRELGFSVWMDDFGSGYSSPDILQRVHFDVIKLDKAFISQIEKSEGSRIIITELIRLANGLGSETVAEGVETSEQVEFLKEIGCTRVQGFFYYKPISYEEILEMNKKDILKGFENPMESEYYSILGNVNLYDVSFASDEEDESLRNYFDTMPMFIVEVSDHEAIFARGNKSYRDFMVKYHYDLYTKERINYTDSSSITNPDLIQALRKCRSDGKRIVVGVKNKNGDLTHLFLRRIATNPVTGIVAIAIIILDHVNNDAELRHKEALERIRQEQKIYSRITALSGDYICIYNVDPETDHYIEFSIKGSLKSLGIASEGSDFFEQSRKNSLKVLYPDDIDLFLSKFSKESIMREIHEKGVFSLNYRMIFDGTARYVKLKAAMIREDDRLQLIVGLIDIDLQVHKDQEYSKMLMAARNIANVDPLTGGKNKHAYVDAVNTLNDLIKKEDAPDFAVVVFDLNGLKEVNDTQGHQAGDQFIKDGFMCICRTFKHSPVFRIGGDEFVVIAQNDDYRNMDALLEGFEHLNINNRKDHKVVIAAGMSRYHHKDDKSVSQVFERADNNMYINKKQLKEVCL
ncbi:EAL domain-containing protein [Oribacterium sp. WCC10]|uniref:EAL domain-containing protein n=1 Tax=Oribacterium sp. WCC10 TaxID=1855343 RepID=UPI0008F26312|nr:EAL domain-containing protein [Oribacterium sp. WCC10]SFG20793.1 diguanylate cyclase (GGDEF) domain-containing protein [Oribacterium sp. WCC10]